jgi:nitric oxide dioxygenase
VMPNLVVVNFYEDGADGAALPGRMDLARLPSWPRTETEVYMCGPIGFMQAQWKALQDAGVPVARMHREVFGPEALDHIL